MDSDDENNLVDIDKMLLDDPSNPKGQKPLSESFKRVQGELQHLESFKLVEDLLVR